MKDDLTEFYKKSLEFAESDFAGDASKSPLARRKHSALIKRLDVEKQLSKFKAMLFMIEKASSEFRTNAAVVERKIALSTKTPRSFLSGAFAFQKEGALLSIVYATVAVLSENGLAAKWSLQRKISEFLKSAEIANDAIYNYFDRAFILASGKQPELRAKATSAQKTLDALGIAKKITSAEFGWVLCGANDYDGTRWFNKELMDSTLILQHELLILGTRSKDKHAAVLDLFKALSKAKENAEYKCQNFLAAFEKQRKPAPKKSKK